jgi:hypothetical protein
MQYVRFCKECKLKILPDYNENGSLMTLWEKGTDLRLATNEIIVFAQNRLNYYLRKVQSLGRQRLCLTNLLLN